MGDVRTTPLKLSFALWGIVGLHSGTALAQSARTELVDSQTTQRLTRITSFLEQRTFRAQAWQYGWMGFGYAVTGGFTTLAITSTNKTDRLDFAFAAGGALIDTTVHTLGSINVHAASRVRAHPDATAEEQAQKLALAELELSEAAAAERDRRSLLKGHVLPIGLSTVSGLVLWLGFGHLKGAIINTVASTTINELRVWTQPTSAIDEWDRYRLHPDAAPSSAWQRSSAFSWQLQLSPVGCGVIGTF